MRRAVTFAIKGENFRLVHGPEVPLRDQVADFKRAILAPSDSDSLEIWTSDARLKRKKFSAPSAPVAVEPPLLSSEDSAKSKKSKP
jgi:hypothetical protein